jgi:hypothetical protein
MSAIAEMLRETPLGHLIVLAGLAGLALAVVALVLGLSRGRAVGRQIQAVEGAPDRAAPLVCSTWAEMLAIVSMLLAPALAVVAVSIARGELAQALVQTDPS